MLTSRRPRRPRLLGPLLAALLVLPGAALATASSAAAADVLAPVVPAATQEQQILAGLNAQRAAVGVGPVQLDGGLDAVAQRWADVLGQGDGMKHNPDLARLLSGYGRWGEIVATADMGNADTHGLENGDLAVKSWMGSTPHRTVLLDRTYTAAGIGTVYTKTSSGGRTVWRSYWVVDFGSARAATPLVRANADGSQSYAGIPVRGALLDGYRAAGANVGGLGLPTGAQFGPLRGGGAGQHFQGGSLYTSPATGVHAVRGAVRDRWAATGWENGLGYPVSGEFGIRSGLAQRFQGGLVYWSGATGAQVVRGAILDAYGATGWENGFLGLPVQGDTPVRGGAFTHFQGGSVYWSAAAGTHVVRGAIRDAWAQSGWETGRLGFPAGPEHPVAGGVAQQFQGGTLTYSWSTHRTTVG
ncbi:CAP domain-containing protein [Kineococcus rubinsiae]|uniref:CAP domain-containing protein n=1 Tax=Kineococcus rubinsiae TaxID=2609562 RepID=UPI0014322582|nr:CAP domain-containing protein [Kineococcus rubinsiae]NIZ89471.1 hypothetical protein [Kineococcus rubinsiae]